MPAVFVHGVPEVAALWAPMLAELQRDDVVCLSPPGFGAPTPAGWSASREDYATWLVAELEDIDGEVDLVGHDWGGGHVIGAVAQRSDLVRTWASDVVGIFHPSYEWHDNAKIWATPGAGEEFMDFMMGASLDDRIAIVESLGMVNADTRAIAEGMTDEMGRCILALYRSATKELLPSVESLGDGLSAKPGLAIIAGNDPYLGGTEGSLEMASEMGIESVTLDGLGHWWMDEDPEGSARFLEDFWARV